MAALAVAAAPAAAVMNDRETRVLSNLPREAREKGVLRAIQEKCSPDCRLCFRFGHADERPHRIQEGWAWCAE